jgi:hypothetical protein
MYAVNQSKTIEISMAWSTGRIGIDERDGKHRLT